MTDFKKLVVNWHQQQEGEERQGVQRQGEEEQGEEVLPEEELLGEAVQPEEESWERSGTREDHSAGIMNGHSSDNQVTQDDGRRWRQGQLRRCRQRASVPLLHLPRLLRRPRGTRDDCWCVATGALADGSTGAVELGFWRQIAATVLGRLPNCLLMAFFRSWRRAAFVATGQFASSPVGETTPPAAPLMQIGAAEGPDNSSPWDAGRSPNWAASRLAGG
ncbi:unnamed protein product [Merluccius merluccius]